MYTDAYFAKCVALRLRAVAGWALGTEDSQDCVEVLHAWRVLAEAAKTSDLSARNALTLYALIAAHCGNFALAAAAVEMVGCHRPTPWCELLSLLREINLPNQYSRWSEFLAGRVVSRSSDDLVESSFHEGEACMIAGVVSALGGRKADPFRVIQMLRGAPPG